MALSPPGGIEDFKNTCQRALVMDFVILVSRLHRLCTRHEDVIALAFPTEAIKKFRAAVEPIKDIRHANEHGLDLDARKKLKPEEVTPSFDLKLLSPIDTDFRLALVHLDPGR